MSRLQQALRWWRNNVNPPSGYTVIPPRHFKILTSAGALHPCQDDRGEGVWDLNPQGHWLMRIAGYEEIPLAGEEGK